MEKILISVSDFYKDIANILLNSTILKLQENAIQYEKIFVPGAFELASSINMALENYEYSGAITLGCVVRGETSHYDIIIRESARAIQDISIYYSLPLGFGLLTVDNLEQAFTRAERYAINATEACIRMMKIKERFAIYNDKKPCILN